MAKRPSLAFGLGVVWNWNVQILNVKKFGLKCAKNVQTPVHSNFGVILI